MFFGVPHDGMDNASLIPMVENGHNRYLVESIGSVNSYILSTQRREFHKALRPKGDSEVLCFYETQKSPTAQQVSRSERKKVSLDEKLTHENFINRTKTENGR